LAITKLEPSALFVKIIFFCLKSSMIAGLIAAGFGRLEIFIAVLLLSTIIPFVVSLISIFTFSDFESSKIFLFATSLLFMVSMMSSKDAPDFI